MTMDVDTVLQSLTLEEKISLLAGDTFWATRTIPSKGVPSIQTCDGPNGVRTRDTTATCFPAATSVAATFDPKLAAQLGRALGREARNRGGACVLGPTVCIHRHPLGGRNFESYSEDPLLTGRMAASMVRGLQSGAGVAATLKHFVANEQETERMTVDEAIGARALREIYLRPFEMVINGTHCDASRWLLDGVLRGDWGWRGLVMSDWGGTNSVAASLDAGLDLEMPGPARVRKGPRVLDAVRNGEVSEEVITRRARNVLELAKTIEDARSAISYTPQSKEDEIREHGALVREAGARGIVLLKNEGNILPLRTLGDPSNDEGEKTKLKIACIGFAQEALIHGGGSASVNAHYSVTPWEALQAALGDSVELTYAKGAHTDRYLPALQNDGSAGTVTGLDGNPGFSRVFYEEDATAPSSTAHGQPDSTYSPLGTLESLWKTLELVCDFVPRESGQHYLSCTGIGPTQVLVDDQVVIDQPRNCRDPMGALFGAVAQDEVRHRFEAGRAYRVVVRSRPPAAVGLEILEGKTGARLGFALASARDADLQADAVRAAAAADVTLVFTGHTPAWETEGRDQASFHLPRQDALVAAVARARPGATVVVNATGVAVAMPWLGDVAAVLQAWFPGQEAGAAVVDVLTGRVNPEGHLPYGPQDGKLRVNYAEGVFVGYRHYDRIPRDKVNFPFGHGLSYTTFDLAGLQVKTVGRTAERDKGEGGEQNKFILTASITNTGSLAGATAVQLYVGRVAESADHPVKTLVAFEKVRLEPGEKKEIELVASARDFAYYEEVGNKWAVDSGEYRFLMGFSAENIVQEVRATLDRDLVWKP
ncbi:uncharacterized protein PG998_004519 [Apiospora kogelbergensis]|uniref:uncharacterized protein n=1 Tax=Apiospora kogelbergensis TaxID=1337665 RepID=UPI00312FF1A3